MSLVVTSVPTDEPISLEEAKRHLGVYVGDHDDRIMQVVTAAREWCESQVSRTLRGPVTRVENLDNFWRGKWQAPYPPLLSVESINYYDVDDADTEFDSDNYRVILSTDGPGHVEWTTSSASFPSLSTRPDAVRIEYTAGYATVPTKAKQAILIALKMFFDPMPQEYDINSRAAQALLNSCDWGSYA